MKNYSLEAIIDGRMIVFKETFTSRSSAMNFFYQIYDMNHSNEFVVNEEYYINGDIHSIEYVFNYNNRFRVIRTK